MTEKAKIFFKNPIVIAVSSGFIMLMVGIGVGNTRAYLNIPAKLREFDKQLKEKEKIDIQQDEAIEQLRAENKKLSEVIIRIDENQKYTVEKIGEINSSLKDLRNAYITTREF